MSAAESAAGLALVELLALAAARWGDETARRLEGPVVAMLNARDGQGKRKWSDEQIGLKVCQLIYGPGKPDPRVLAQGTSVHVPGQTVISAEDRAKAQEVAKDLITWVGGHAAERQEAERQAEAKRRAAAAAEAAQDGAA